MKKTIALLLLIFPIYSFAQITFQSGYFIENGNKTECLIKNLAWKNNPVSIEYKLSENETVQVKNIKEISEFSVNDAYKYKRYTVAVDRSGIGIDKLSEKKDPKWKTETLFLKVLVEGRITLYQYENGNFVKYFYSTGDTKAEQLVYKEYSVEGRVGENNFFRQQLFNLMKDGATKMSDFERLKYRKEDLVKLVAGYNGTTGEKTVNNLSEKQNNGSVNFKFTPGASFSKLSAGYSSDFSNTEFAFSRQPAFRIGVEVEYVMPFNNNKWSLLIDPNYQYYKTDAEKPGKYTTKINYTYIEVPIGFRHYMYLNENSRFFVDAAYVVALELGDSYLQYNGAIVDISKNSGFALGGGFSYKKYSVEARYGFNHGIATDPAWETQYNSISIILGYKLF
jgi:hypothetical protein